MRIYDEDMYPEKDKEESGVGAEPPSNRDWSITFTGRKIYPLDPKVYDIKILDIAHSLSNQCRFGGHTKQFYSVADHCIRVSNYCSDENKLWGLLHDAAETYLVDLPRPIKNHPSMIEYSKAEFRLMEVITLKFNLPTPIPQEVIDADNLFCYTELYHLMPLSNFTPDKFSDWVDPIRHFDKVRTPEQAKEEFIGLFNELY